MGVDEQSAYAVIIDGILETSDLNTVSAKHIRKRLQAQVGHDLTHQKVNTATGTLMRNARNTCESVANSGNCHSL